MLRKALTTEDTEINGSHGFVNEFVLPFVSVFSVLGLWVGRC